MNLSVYFRQAWHLLRENPVLSGIAILGTALSVCMIMVTVIVFRLSNAPMSPEGNRDRILYVRWMTAQMKHGETGSNGAMSYPFAKKIFKSLKSAEAVAVANPFCEQVMISAPGAKSGVSFDMKSTDDGFWKVFDHSFVAGKPYTKADVDAALPKMVITELVAKKVFGSNDVIGKTILMDYSEYTVVGVVRNVSASFEYAYSQVWVPLTSQSEMSYYADQTEGIAGIFSTYILAPSSNDFEKIREEIKANADKYNSNTKEWYAEFRGQPDNHFISTQRNFANEDVNAKPYVTTTIITLFMLLLIPALNLSGITGSHMRKRLAELGVRRSFGASRGKLVSQVFFEGLVQTLIGGALGLLLSYAVVVGLKDMIVGTYYIRLSSGAINIDLLSLINPTVIFVALLICLLLNVISAIIPAWMAAKRPIINSLHSR